MDHQTVVKQLLASATGRADAAQWDMDTVLLGNIAELDSMAIVTFFTALEDEYGVFVEDDEVSAEVFESLGDLVAFISPRLG